MNLAFDQKEDLRLRLMDLKQKLVESEEERRKLEKTCDMLIKAFKEEQKFHYKTLNNKYEKFLEDCKLRRRRNDIILQSLCRIEDKARILFTKTERLKLLKDHYVSHLKHLELKKNVSFNLRKEIFSKSSLPSKDNANDECKRKSVHWKVPHVGDTAQDFESAKSSSHNQTEHDTSTGNFHESIAYSAKDDLKPSSSFQNLAGVSELKREKPNVDLESMNKLNPREVNLQNIMNDKKFPTDVISVDYHNQLKNSEDIDGLKYKNNSTLNEKNRQKSFEVFEEITSSDVELEFTNLKNAVKLKEEETIYQKSIEKLKMTLPSSEFPDNEKITRKSLIYDEPYGKIIEKDEIESSEKIARNYKSEDENWISQSMKQSSILYNDNEKIVEESEDQEAGTDEREENDSIDYNFPKGLDGVDYDNETYPASYYEQPVRDRNPSNICSNVILEEDEYEQEDNVDVPVSGLVHGAVTSPKDFIFTDSDAPKNEELIRSKDLSFVDDSLHKTKESNNSNCDSDSERRTKQPSTPGPQILTTDTSTKNVNNMVRSNLVNLLESDSESFQIEHGEPVSGNEDSDFDFSFH